MDAPNPSALPTFASRTPLHIGAIGLTVRDLDRLSEFYRDVLGLSLLDRGKDSATLGAGGVAIVHLEHQPSARPDDTRTAGLYHTAFLMPTRADLARWILHVARHKVPLTGASDHGVSEAFYLDDPEGNGIEVYADRPRSGWQWNGSIVEMRNSALDVRGILADGAKLATASVFPEGTRVGHVHMRVGGIPEAEQFYGQVLGFDITRRREGATFYATGRYHHHLATNTWESRGSARRPGTTTGLAALALTARDSAAFDATAERMIAIGGRWRANSIIAEDPWGNVVELSKA